MWIIEIFVYDFLFFFNDNNVILYLSCFFIFFKVILRILFDFVIISSFNVRNVFKFIFVFGFLKKILSLGVVIYKIYIYFSVLF